MPVSRDGPNLEIGDPIRAPPQPLTEHRLRCPPPKFMPPQVHLLFQRCEKHGRGYQRDADAGFSQPAGVRRSSCTLQVVAWKVVTGLRWGSPHIRGEGVAAITPRVGHSSDARHYRYGILTSHYTGNDKICI